MDAVHDQYCHLKIVPIVCVQCALYESRLSDKLTIHIDLSSNLIAESLIVQIVPIIVPIVPVIVPVVPVIVPIIVPILPIIGPVVPLIVPFVPIIVQN